MAEIMTKQLTDQELEFRFFEDAEAASSDREAYAGLPLCENSIRSAATA